MFLTRKKQNESVRLIFNSDNPTCGPIAVVVKINKISKNTVELAFDAPQAVKIEVNNG